VNRTAAPGLVVTGSLIPKQVSVRQPKVQAGTKPKRPTRKSWPLEVWGFWA